MGWLTSLKRRLVPSSARSEDVPSEPDHQEYHPAHEGDTPENLHRGRRRLKETFTNHWDLDYLPREEVEALLEKQKKSGR